MATAPAPYPGRSSPATHVGRAHLPPTPAGPAEAAPKARTTSLGSQLSPRALELRTAPAGGGQRAPHARLDAHAHPATRAPRAAAPPSHPPRTRPHQQLRPDTQFHKRSPKCAHPLHTRIPTRTRHSRDTPPSSVTHNSTTQTNPGTPNTHTRARAHTHTHTHTHTLTHAESPIVAHASAHAGTLRSPQPLAALPAPQQDAVRRLPQPKFGAAGAGAGAGRCPGRARRGREGG